MKIFIPALFAGLILSCDHRPANFEGGDSRGILQVKKVEVAIEEGEEDSADQSVTETDRKLIRTGYMEMEVKNVAIMKMEVDKICKEYNAYISSEDQTNYKEKLEYEQAIRIPAGNFDAFIQKVESLASEVNQKNIQTQDVTEEFIDKEARIKTKKELEIRYREILKRADEVSDILSIEAQLNHVRGDIESMEGRLNYLRNQAAFSTLTLTFYEPIGAEFGFGSRTAAAFSNGWDMFLFAFIGIV
ncbi:MAG TPA: DUF4349 domain-containing protein, partial [Chryseosolibacter sp.]|nr:DUF4349 domain-containing protein [Chryseosolibacter sp.]